MTTDVPDNDEFEVVVIVPTIIINDWLHAAVASLIEQEDIKVRIVVFHDGVQPDAASPWASHPQITVLHSEERIGLAAGLATAISQTSEPYIARLDADDLALPDRLAKQLAFLKKGGLSLVGSQAEVIDEHGAVKSPLRPHGGNDIRRSLLRRNTLFHSSVMFTREAYEKADGYNPALRLFEDYDLWLRMALDGKIAIIPEILINYRVHSNQMSRGARPIGAHITAVSSGQKLLGEKLGVPAYKVINYRMQWRLAQFMRFYGLRRAGFDK